MKGCLDILRNIILVWFVSVVIESDYEITATIIS